MNESYELLEAPLTIEYDFNRTTGPVIGAFLTALTKKVIVGINGSNGEVICPPVEFDPHTGEQLTTIVPLGSTGTVTSWSWVNTPRSQSLLQTPHALALIKIDGATTSMLHVVNVASPHDMITGMTVQAEWSDERTGAITDICCFIPTDNTKDGAQ